MRSRTMSSKRRTLGLLSLSARTFKDNRESREIELSITEIKKSIRTRSAIVKNPKLNQFNEVEIPSLTFFPALSSPLDQSHDRIREDAIIHAGKVP